MFEALAIPWAELLKLADIPLSQWLEDHGASLAIQMLMAVLCANLGATTPSIILEHMSVLGAIGGLRSLVCGEGPMTVIEPDVREGLLVPLAEAIEHQGGSIWRRCPVREVIHDSRSVKGVLLEDGRQINTDLVAVATGTARVGKLVPEMPPDIQSAVDQARLLGCTDIAMFSVLNQPVVDIDRYTLVASETGENLAWLFPMHSLAPWSTQPGKQFLVALSFHTTEQFEATGGEAAAIARLTELQYELFPGFGEATEAVEYQRHRHFWMNPMCHGPKLPSKSATIEGLWFAGDGSMPIGGIAIEAAVSAGVLRAQQIATELRS
jgi:phytoene dehydrogenase-like protein